MFPVSFIAIAEAFHEISRTNAADGQPEYMMSSPTLSGDEGVTSQRRLINALYESPEAAVEFHT